MPPLSIIPLCQICNVGRQNRCCHHPLHRWSGSNTVAAFHFQNRQHSFDAFHLRHITRRRDEALILFASPTSATTLLRHQGKWQQTLAASAFLSTTTGPSSELENHDQIKKLLCHETFPIGTLGGRRVGAAIVTATENLIAKKSSEGVVLAFELLDRLSQEAQYHHARNRSMMHEGETSISSIELEFFIPSSLLHDIIDAWMSCWKDKDSRITISPRDAFEKLQRLMVIPRQTSESTLIAYSQLIHAAAKSQDPDLAEQILNYLLESKSEINLHPDAVCFTSVIDAWAHSVGREDEAPYRAEAILKEMIKLSDAGWHEATPNVISYNTVIAAWASSNDEHAPQRAEQLLREMQDRNLSPDTFSYSSVLTTWSRSKQDRAPNRAYEILQHMNVLYEQQGIVEAKPNTHCYSAVISAFLNRGDTQEAEKVLNELLNRFLSTKDRDFLPNYAFNAIIYLWSKSSNPESPLLAEALLQGMQDLAEFTGEPSIQPDTITFNAVLSTWARSKKANAPYRCEQIMQRMQDLYDGGLVDCQPNVVSFSTVIDCWAKSGNKEAPQWAEAILRHMIQSNEADGMAVKPNTITYNTVMNAWAQSRRSDAVLHVEALFDEMLQKHQAGDHDLKPNLETYVALISAWGWSRRKDGALKAQTILDGMIARYRNCESNLKPNVAIYGAVINAWAKAGDPERAEKILREMELLDEGATKPNVVAYTSVIDAWARCSGVVPNAAERAHSLFEEMKQKHKEGGDRAVKPNLHTYTALMTAWKRSRRRNRTTKTQAVYDDLLDSYKSGDQSLKPNSWVYTIMFDLWSEAGSPEKVDRILQQMKSFGTKPDIFIYTKWMDAWYRSRHCATDKKVEKILALFDEVMSNYKAGDRDWKPNLRILQIVISTLRYSEDGAGKAQALFDSIIDAYQAGDNDLKPNVFLYNALIRAWATAKAPEKAEAILRDLESSHHENNNNNNNDTATRGVFVQPNILSYNAVISAWCHSGHPDGVERAQSIYDEILQQKEFIQPTEVTYDTLISAWCNHNKNTTRDASDSDTAHSASVKKAQYLFDHMMARYNAGEITIKSDKLANLKSIIARANSKASTHHRLANLPKT